MTESSAHFYLLHEEHHCHCCATSNASKVDTLPMSIDESRNDFMRTILDLNNRGSVSLLDGDYSVANNLFELAMKRLKDHSESESGVLPPSHLPVQFCDCDCHSSLPLDELDDSTESLPAPPSRSPDSDEISTVPVPFKSSRSSSNLRIKRMTSTSTLPMNPFYGQQELNQAQPAQCQTDHKFYQQVYCLPIVLDEGEWNNASTKDKSFVLLFNSALCNHLLGMELLGSRQNLKQQGHEHTKDDRDKRVLDEMCSRVFITARVLYRLGLENASSFIHGVDKICYLAMFNNMSHVCKTMDGFNSIEAFAMDKHLLKAIYWWKDTECRRIQETATWARTSPATSNTSYVEEDAEIIDAFLDNTFYLVGVQQNVAPAPVA